MKNTFQKRLLGSVFIVAGLGLSSAYAADFTSAVDGDWSTTTTWTPNGNPNTGEFAGAPGNDSVTISAHDVTVDQDTYGGSGAPTPRFTVNNGNSITINNGGSLTTAAGDGSALVGEASAGTVNVNDGTFSYGGGGNIFVGYNNGGAGVFNLGDGTGAAGSAIFQGNGRLLSLGGNGSAGASGTMNIAGDGRVINTRLAVGHGGGSPGTLTISGTGQYQTTGGTALNYVGVNNSSDGWLNLEDNATLTWRGTRAFRIGSGNTSQGTINISDSATLIGTSTEGFSDRGIVVGWDGEGTVNISDNANVTIGSSFSLGHRNTSDGWVNQTGGAVTAQNVFMGRNGGGQGTYTISAGTLNVGNRIGPGLGGDGTFDQQGGTVTTPRINFSEAGGGQGTYLLNGGTLRTDLIDLDFNNNADPDGIFVWGNGTLTMRQVNAGSAGGIDYTQNPSVNGDEQIVRSGTTILVDDGGLTTAGTVGDGSVLDLGGLYLNGGTRQDILVLDGTLDLSGVDTLISVDSPNLLRPRGVNALDWGTIPLITAGSISGTFDNIILPGADGRPFYAWTGAPISDPANLNPNSYYFEQTANQLLFHYKVAGNVPEPATGSFIVLGIVLLRFMGWAMRNRARA